MQHEIEVLPPELNDFRLPPGLELPRNVVLTESEAAAFVRETEDKFRKRRLNGTGPTFVRREDETFGAKYLIWDLLAWLVQNRRNEIPERSRRGRKV